MSAFTRPRFVLETREPRPPTNPPIAPGPALVDVGERVGNLALKPPISERHELRTISKGAVRTCRTLVLSGGYNATHE